MQPRVIFCDTLLAPVPDTNQTPQEVMQKPHIRALLPPQAVRFHLEADEHMPQPSTAPQLASVTHAEAAQRALGAQEAFALATQQPAPQQVPGLTAGTAGNLAGATGEAAIPKNMLAADNMGSVQLPGMQSLQGWTLQTSNIQSQVVQTRTPTVPSLPGAIAEPLPQRCACGLPNATCATCGMGYEQRVLQRQPLTGQPPAQEPPQVQEVAQVGNCEAPSSPMEQDDVPRLDYELDFDAPTQHAIIRNTRTAEVRQLPETAKDWILIQETRDP